MINFIAAMEALFGRCRARTSNPVGGVNDFLGVFDSHTPPPFHKIKQFPAGPRFRRIRQASNRSLRAAEEADCGDVFKKYVS